MLDLTGKYFIVTGGTRGLGATIARRLADAALTTGDCIDYDQIVFGAR